MAYGGGASGRWRRNACYGHVAICLPIYMRAFVFRCTIDKVAAGSLVSSFFLKWLMELERHLPTSWELIWVYYDINVRLNSFLNCVLCLFRESFFCSYSSKTCDHFEIFSLWIWHTFFRLVWSFINHMPEYSYTDLQISQKDHNTKHEVYAVTVGQELEKNVRLLLRPNLK